MEQSKIKIFKSTWGVTDTKMKRTEVKKVDIFYLFLVVLVELTLVATIITVSRAEAPREPYHVIDTETVSTVTRSPVTE